MTGRSEINAATDKETRLIRNQGRMIVSANMTGGSYILLHTSSSGGCLEFSGGESRLVLLV